MVRNRFVSVLAIAALAGVLATAGCVSAATKPSAAAATASARAAAATSGTANIVIYGVNTDGAYWHAIVSGVIGDYGPAVSIYPVPLMSARWPAVPGLRRCRTSSPRSGASWPAWSTGARPGRCDVAAGRALAGPRRGQRVRRPTAPSRPLCGDGRLRHPCTLRLTAIEPRRPPMRAASSSETPTLAVLVCRQRHPSFNPTLSPWTRIPVSVPAAIIAPGPEVLSWFVLPTEEIICAPVTREVARNPTAPIRQALSFGNEAVGLRSLSVRLRWTAAVGW